MLHQRTLQVVAALALVATTLASNEFGTKFLAVRAPLPLRRAFIKLVSAE